AFFGVYPYAGLRSELNKPFIPEQSESCVGALDIAEKIAEDGYLRVTGWLYDPNPQSVPELIRFIGNDDVSVGFAVTGMQRADVAQAVGNKALYAGFIGYIHSAPSGQVTAI